MSRYIDADKHLQKLRERRNAAIMWELHCDEETKDRAQEAILIFNECISELIDEPTADVRENVKSEWVLTDHAYTVYCKKCGYKHNRASQYCPECGAYMTNGTKWFGADMRQGGDAE